MPSTSPRLNKIEFAFQPELGDYKTIDGDRYLNPWINYTVPKAVQVSQSIASLQNSNCCGTILASMVYFIF